MTTTTDFRAQRIEHRRQMNERLERHMHEAKYPTQRPNGATPFRSEWFTDAHGVQCRLLSDDPETIAAYSAMMARRGE